MARCAALAEFLQHFGWRCDLYTAADPKSVLPRAARHFTRIHNDVQAASACGLAVFDGYGIDRRVESGWRAASDRIVVIDDLANRPHDTDILVDSTPGRQATDYSGLVPQQCRFLLGLPNAMLRRSLVRQRQSSHERSGPVVVAMGATDPTDCTGAVLEALAGSVERRLQVILGPSAPHLWSLRERFGHIVDILVDPEDLDEQMSRASLVIGAAGGAALERAFLGTPSINCIVAENQRGLGTALAEFGAAIPIDEGRLRDASALQQMVADVLADRDALRRMSERGRLAVDGRGVERITGALARPRCLLGTTVRLRAFEREDSDWLYWLQTRPETRRYALNPRIPAEDEHAAWIEHTLCSAPQRLLLILETTTGRAGIVRLDCQDGRHVVSVVVSPEFHRRGVGSSALSCLREIAPGLALDAYVKNGNDASVRLFRSSGYRQIEAQDHGNWYRHTP